MSQSLDLRQFLYIDVERARSVLSQLTGGVPETDELDSGDSKAASGSVGAGVFSVSAELTQQKGRTISRSLQERAFVDAESALEKLGFLFDLDTRPEFRDPSTWASSEIHEILTEGQIVRITADIQILDPSFSRARFERVNEFARAIAAMQIPNPSSFNPKQLESKVRQVLTGMWDGTDPEALRMINDVVGSLTGGEIALRILPCSFDFSDYSFGGVLLSRSANLQEEREALFGRYGAVMGSWTTVMQIEAVPVEAGPDEAADLDTAGLMGAGSKIRRVGVEKLMLDLGALMDSIGITEGPSWPSVTMTPLAVYRSVPPAP